LQVLYSGGLGSTAAAALRLREAIARVCCAPASLYGFKPLKQNKKYGRKTFDQSRCAYFFIAELNSAV
jgi:hypothetical protein